MKIVTHILIGVFLLRGSITEYYANESLPIMELGRQTGPEYVYLPNDYGFLIYWLDNKEPELYVYDKPVKKLK